MVRAFGSARVFTARGVLISLSSTIGTPGREGRTRHGANAAAGSRIPGAGPPSAHYPSSWSTARAKPTTGSCIRSRSKTRYHVTIAHSHHRKRCACYLLTEEQRFLDEYQATAANVYSDIEHADQVGRRQLCSDRQFKPVAGTVEARLNEFEKAIDFANVTTPRAASRCCARPTPARRLGASMI